MKLSDLALLAASAAAVYLVFAAKDGKVSFDWVPWKKAAPDYNGYQYFNDGSSGLVITPSGEYILNGQVVWSPKMSGGGGLF